MSEVGSLTSIEPKYEYEWKIPNFRSYAGCESGKLLFSPSFRTYHSGIKNSTNTVSLQWKLIMYPGGYDETRSRYIGVYVNNCNDFEVTSNYSLRIMAPGDSNNNILRPSGQSRIFQPKGFLGDPVKNTWSSWGWHEFAENNTVFSEKSKFLVNDTFTISCSIFETSISAESHQFTNASPAEVHNHFENLLETGKFSDVMFIIREKSMQLHKAILTNESAVFQAMFDHEMKEQIDNVVNIVDVDFNVMKELLRHIYAKKVNGINEIADDLLVAADKYCLTGLKDLCQNTLCKTLNAENCLQRLELAVKYDAKNLKSKAVEFIVKNLKEIAKKEEFKSLSPDCKHELLMSMANNQ